MKTVANNYAANFHRPGFTTSSLSETLLLAKIGDDLRQLYHDVTTSSPPAELLDLARMIDDRTILARSED